jgi:UDP-N-acetylglucosamine diphosphorylase / glucose-1-phosphate thymidylyltransferase / UDP-N-acetylgalactosamine diphosphorylase / glucosamine-1-phosphate N-acetyltransferase / galactosamine-1-phosphate N-acetyltransferase
MKLILVDVCDKRSNFYPLSLSRPVWELRVAMSSLADKLIAKLKPTETAGFVPEYMAASYKAKTSMKVNDLSVLQGDDLLLLNPTIKACATLKVPAGNEFAVNAQGDILYVRVAKAAGLPTDSIMSFVKAAAEKFPKVTLDLPTWNYTWELVLQNPEELRHEFAAAGRSGIEGTIEQPNAIRGSAKNVFVAKGVTIHPMVVLDAANGPIYIDEGAEIHPFTRIEGPCYIGKKSILLGTKCREGMSIGPMCRVGGEVEESIIHGYSNKYHDGFLGHAYVGEWVNLGALTTNSDLKNDYGNVSVMLDGKNPIDTGSTKVGSLIGDHTKTSIGTLFNTGSVVGAMCLILATGKPLPKFLPSFAWFLEGVTTKGFGKGKLYGTAKIAMSRRKKEWTPAEEAMWDAIFALTAGPRDEAVKKGRKAMIKG